MGICRSPRNGERVRALGAEPIALDPATGARAAPRRGQFLMPIGYWWTVAFMSWGVACALTRWPRLGSFCAIPALVASELPFIVGYLLIASTVLALVDGDLDSPGGAAWRRRRAIRAGWSGGRRGPCDARARGIAQRRQAGAAVGPYPARPVLSRPARRGPGPRAGLRRRAAPHAGCVPPPRPARRRADPAALPRRRLLLRQQGPRSKAADPAPDHPTWFRLRERRTTGCSRT